MKKSVPLRHAFCVLAGLLLSAGQKPASAGESNLQDDGPTLEIVADHLARETAARCFSRFDGDVAKGEVPNAGLADLIGAGKFQDVWPGMDDKIALAALDIVAAEGFTFCNDSRFNSPSSLKTQDGRSVGSTIHFNDAKTETGGFRDTRIIALRPGAERDIRREALSAALHLSRIFILLADARENLRAPRGLPVDPKLLFNHPIAITVASGGDFSKSVAVYGDPVVRASLPMPAGRSPVDRGSPIPQDKPKGRDPVYIQASAQGGY